MTSDQKIQCASCCERSASGTIFINYTPYPEKKSARKKALPDLDCNRGMSDRNRGMSVHMPICWKCMQAAIKVNVEIKRDDHVWATAGK